MLRIETITKKLQPLRKQLQEHQLYTALQTIDDVKVFMEGHVYAVWDFMSLLKALQNKLTCNQVPWVPVVDSETARFINEIVHGEETDINELGQPKSHFEMYLEAMQELGADTHKMEEFIGNVRNASSITAAMDQTGLKPGVYAFMKYTFDVIATDKAHVIAAAFTFGREDVIPDMFLEILKESEKQGVSGAKLKYYLERHIELDGDEHGPLSLKMIENLCGDDDEKWQEIEETAINAMEARIGLWNHLQEEIKAVSV